MRFRFSDATRGDNQAMMAGIAVIAKNKVAGKLDVRASASNRSHNEACVIPTYNTGAARYCIPVQAANSIRLRRC
jgi:hypothetical protein